MGNEKELTEQLAAMGFTDEGLIRDLKNNIKWGLPSFQILFRQKFGEDLMLYSIRFSATGAENYTINGYEATLRFPVDINHRILNGIDTAALDKTMAGIDWYSYFREQEKNNTAEIRQVFGHLNVLGLNSEKAAEEIQQKLIFKHFPAGSMDCKLREPLEFSYERTSWFSFREHQMENAALAYYTLNGTKDAILEQLEISRLDRFAETNVVRRVKEALSKDQDEFQLSFSHSIPGDGFAEFSAILKKDNRYKIEEYHVRFYTYPELNHGQILGVDTSVLEKEMQKVDWKDLAKYTITDDEGNPDVTAEIASLMNQVNRIQGDGKGKEIAQVLQLKYWTGTDFFDGWIEQEAWDRLESFRVTEKHFPADFYAPQALNLMAGRAVCTSLSTDWDAGTAKWNILDSTGTIREVSGYEEVEMNRLLAMVPLDPGRYANARNKLIQGLLLGNFVPVVLGNGKRVNLQAAPENKNLIILSEDRRLIPVNLQYDPDWKPNIPSQQEAVLNNKELKKNRQRKGPKL